MTIIINCLLFLFTRRKSGVGIPFSPYPRSAVPGYKASTLFYIGQVTGNKRKALFRLSEIHYK